MADGTHTALPKGHVLAWYGDDLTGAAAVMEVLATACIRSVLFMDVPTPDELAPYASWPGIGIAGTARHRDPQWMVEHLPPVFDFLSSLSAPVAHYKVCSTFDSSPEIGSIGKAIELAQPALGGEWTPLVLAAPRIGRYQVYGNLFAEAEGVVYRIDRHPTMSRHPVTPMHESDVRLHLADQTALPIGLIDVESIRRGDGADTLAQQIAEGKRIVALDVADNGMLAQVGALIWENRGDRLLAVGSQGIEYALVEYWRTLGLLEPHGPIIEFDSADRFAAVSASVSPVTAAQLTWADANGFDLVRIDVASAADALQWSVEIQRVGDIALESIDRGNSPIVYTALGPDDASVRVLRKAVERSNAPVGVVSERIGDGLGQILNRLIRDSGITRCAVAGGDTSGQVTRTLGIRSLTYLAQIDDGTSIMRADITTRDRSALEYALKGGQMGAVDFFARAKNLRSKT